jgi:phosphatidylinositol alpha-1,6-mannosyltransferase
MLVGGGDYGLELARRADRVGVRENVLLTGSVPFADLPGYYAAADVFAMPCRTRGRGLDVEGLGIVFLEASAAGLPVVAGESGGAPETVEEGTTGTVVDGRDVDAVAAACIGLLTDADRAAAWGRAGREWVQHRWTWDASAERLVALLDG